MEKELKDLKSVLRSIVVSSPAQVDVRALQRDYKSMMGASIPVNKYGYRDVLAFLKERCNDCFLFNGLPSNPVLTLIVPDSLKHIDQFVQKQKPSATTKMRGKRRSVLEMVSKPPTYNRSNMVCETFNKNQPSKKNNTRPEVKPPDIKVEQTSKTSNAPAHTMRNSTQDLTNGTISTPKLVPDNVDGTANSKLVENICNSNNLHNFFKKRLPPTTYDSSQHLDGESCSEFNMGSSKEDKEDNDSGRQTSSSQSSTRKAQLDELKCEISELINAHEDGVWCTDLLRLYRERHGRELNFNRFGYTNLSGLLCDMRERVCFSTERGGVRVRGAGRAPPAPAARAARPAPPAARLASPVDPDDALPGIDFDPDVFPADCMHYMESIPALALGGVRPGAMLGVTVGEVYSPSHFWLQLLGDEHSVAMDLVMDEMAEYYKSGEGAGRALAHGARRAGHYCSSLYDGDWHRSLIVKVLDADTVKVRHVDYGTVDTVGAGALRPLLRRWAELPAQAVRARLAGLRPAAAGRRWPHAAAAHFLHLVRDRRFVANVVAVDPEEDILETFLIDTSGPDDVCVSTQLVRAGHADARTDSALRAAECYLHPSFEALESGATPNFGEIHRYLADGIALEYVEAYRLHVPSAMPAAPPASPPAPPAAARAPPPLELINRVPLLRLESPPPAPRSPSPRPAVAAPAGAVAAALPLPLPPRPWVAALPPGLARGGEVRLSRQECDIYSLLSALDPAAAHCYMLSAMRRAAAGGPAPHPLGLARPPGPTYRPPPPPGFGPPARPY